MSKENQFYSNLKDGRCKGCQYGKRIGATGGFQFLGCCHNPYKGKWVAEIEKCPKEDASNG